MPWLRVLARAVVPVVIVVLFAIPLTVLRRNPDAADLDLALTGADASILADPRIAAGWEASEIATYYPNDEVGPGRPPLSDRINGGDVAFYEYGFRRLYTLDLRASTGDRRAQIEEYRMVDAAAACGIWTLNRDRSDEPFGVAVRAAGGADRAVLCHGARFVSMSAEGFDETTALSPLVEAIATVLRESDPAASPVEFPLPGVPCIPGSQRLIAGPVGAQDIPLPTELLGASRTTPVYQFAVPSGETFVPAVARRDSDGAWTALARHFEIAEGEAGVRDEYEAGEADSRYLVTRHGGHIVIGYMIATPEERDDFREALGR